jgi:hypothetical protein
VIDIKFKDCCMGCIQVDPDINTEILFAENHRVVEKIVVIKCSHDKVCKAYLEMDINETTAENPPCKVGDLVSAKVLRPFNGHEVMIEGEIIAIKDDMFRVRHAGRYVDFLLSDIGVTVFIKGGFKLEEEKTNEKRN